jgi:N-methylhydantoinase A
VRVATDIGGTFTDLVYLDPATNAIGFSKASSTPPDFARGILDAIAKSPVAPPETSLFVHGCTVVINALTERKGARTALVTTKGFRDVLEIGRANRPDLYNLRFDRQPPFVPRAWRYEVRERLNFKGEVQIPLDESDVAAVAAMMRAESIEAVAICFLHSYGNAVHERRCAEILRDLLPGVYVSISADITKEWREYERTQTVVLNSYVQPVTARYLDDLEGALRGLGVSSSLNVMKSNGGTNTFAVSKEQPLHLVESGPVGGVIGARIIGESLGITNLITLDVGGTTAKTSLVDQGEVKFTTEYRIERDQYHAGYPIQVPVVDIVEIGAGGGSIAWIDQAGALQIGPQSAGAVPGPACYGKGGTQPTVTDANLIASRINHEYYLGGAMTVSLDAAMNAMRPIADHFDRSVEDAALGVIRVADGHLMNAIKLVSVRRGYDPRDFTLVAMGGGGPMHAAALARELRIGKVIIPISPGTFSAWGMLVSEPKQDFIRTRVIRSADESLDDVAEVYHQTESEARVFMDAAGYPVNQLAYARYADMRYVGQEHTVRIALGSELDRADIEARFHNVHERAYTFRLDTGIEFVNFQVTVIVTQPAPDLSKYAPRPGAKLTPKQIRRVAFDGGWYDTQVFARDQIPAQEPVTGPAIIEEPSATTVIHPGQRAHLDRLGNLILELEA